ncbi:glycosyltransferase [Paracoccus alkanivorans]|uniref:Rhamnosyl transferase n=1 Tax=Paracoccus alkanivorans TaxID=2116655 RepID=A0A3M0MNI9_9RHOB|nr:glycosyltransferase [Paracoccus alkanivorans]RMC37894.1 hypothetical protein C9E81_03970 [Paracoccus alkanivorans]
MRRNIVGICRFSFLGHGDWKAFNGVGKDSGEEIIQSLREKLFDEQRLEHRFETFEAITLPGLDAQTDKNFAFIALTSDELPEKYWSRLKSLSERYPFLEIVRLPVMSSGRAVEQAYKKLGVKHRSVVQFRLDDDDTVGCHYISRLRQAWSMMNLDLERRPFAITFPNVMVCGPVVTKEGISESRFMRRFLPHNAAGQAIGHRRKNIMQWSHTGVGRKLMSFSDPSIWVLQSYFSYNDTGALTPWRMKKQRIEEIPRKKLEQIVKTNFPFLSIV